MTTMTEQKSSKASTALPITKSKPTITKPHLMAACHHTGLPISSSISSDKSNVTATKEQQQTNNQRQQLSDPQYFLKPNALSLTPAEERLFSTLLSAATFYSESHSSTPPITIRVAGGWVRDKILSRFSHDVDIVIDSMSGVEFATIVRDFLDTIEHPDRHKMGVIGANPEQSKHLETATMTIFGIDVDFVHLRGQEVYESDSRIPHQMTHFGTPLDDALRRDFTINSLFYNINTTLVEDHTSRGLADLLSHHLIVTPLCPRVTFRDDPLRVLRAIRFGVRYGFDLDEELKMAAGSEEVKKSLMIKVSRERVGKELEGMLTGKGAKPIVALGLIVELGLGESVFEHPEGVVIKGEVLCHEESGGGGGGKGKTIFVESWKESPRFLSFVPRVLTAVEQMERDWESDSSNGVMMTDTVVDVRLLHLAAFLLPFAELKYVDKKKKDVLVVEWMLRDGIKFKNKDVGAMKTLMENLPPMRSLLIRSRDDCFVNSRLEVGLLLRELRELWVTSLLLATIVEMNFGTDGADRTLDACCAVYKNVFRERLDGCWKTRPLLDGKALIALLNLPKGPVVGDYLRKEIEWMLCHPDGSREECEEYLKAWKKERGDMEEVVLDDEKKSKKKKKKS